jgi:hypothetical protein
MMQNGLNRELEMWGRNTKLRVRTKVQLKGIAIGEMLSYNFYDGVYQNVSLLFVEPKKNNPTPKECERMTIKFSTQFGLPIVFILKPSPTYERQRLMDKGVYFVMSNNYACLPTVVAIEKTSNRKKAKRFSPVAQFAVSSADKKSEWNDGKGDYIICAIFLFECHTGIIVHG